MKKMRNWIALFLITLSMFFVAGCSTKTDDLNSKVTALEETLQSNKDKITELEKELEEHKDKLADKDSEIEDLENQIEMLKNGKYSIKVFDIDDENIGDEQVKYSEYSKVWDALTNKFDVKYTQEEYGPYISSINNSVVDANWYIAIYENGVLAETGVQNLVVDAGDVFEFKVECWNTIESGYGSMDNYDVLVDKTIYHYAKTYMKDSLLKVKTYTGSDFWSYMTVSMMLNNGYDSNIFKYYISKDLKNTMSEIDVNTLSGANIGKYYYVARAAGVDLTNFKEFYQGYLNSNLSDNFSEFATPFIIGPANSLEFTSDKLKTLTETDYEYATKFGVDGACWQISSLALFNKFDSTELEVFNGKLDFGNGTSNALVLHTFASLGISPRDKEYEIDGKDILETLFDTYYDTELNLVKYKAIDTGANFSSNQIYAGLMAYKCSRDLGKAVNAFA